MIEHERANVLLNVRAISKRFPGVQALKEVDLEVRQGEVLAVIGENGAGKSTMMKILAGVQTPDGGQIILDGQRVVIDSIRKASDLGIALIHQELNLADNLDIGANIFLGREPHRFGLIDRRKIDRDSKEVLSRMGLDFPPNMPLRQLSIGYQQMIEIAKALSCNARILIMDEPTSSLSAKESKALFAVIDDLRSQGVSIVYISHRLGEVADLADRVTVLRDGENAGDLSREEITHDRMVRLMVGRDISQFYARDPHPPGEPAIEAIEIRVPGKTQHPLSFSVRAGEIVGIAGLVGSGRTELLQVLFGIDPCSSGTIRVNGQVQKLNSPRDAIRCGIALVPEDRKQHGLILEMAVDQNISLAGLDRNQHLGMLNRSVEREVTAEMTEKFRIVTPSANQPVLYLSGGNQQKVVLGKWLSLGPRVLLLDEPTRGIDIGAKQEIYGIMDQLASEGVAILFVSSEMEEILGISDRTLVMHEGRLAGELSREQLSEEAVMQLATGGSVAV